jgi:maltose O-acetyltransferase
MFYFKNLIYRIIVKYINIYHKLKIQHIKKNLKFCGENINIDNNVTIICPWGLVIGSNTSIACYTTIYAAYGVTIGSNCLISSNVGISSYNHIVNSIDRVKDIKLDELFCKPVTIDDNVWIGMNVCIIPGVVIGKNSVIAAGSVVTKCIPENEIWAGNPAKFIKKINLK